MNTFSAAQGEPQTTASLIDAADDARYLALLAHDARFDGSFFVAVSSTGIYCRPVCRVKVPKRQNCQFYQHAAQAEQAGYRPCLRCRPELAPHSLPWSIQDASAILAHQAARLLDAPEALDNHGAELKSNGVIERLAARLGISDRHVRRIFEAHFGVSPLQYLQTRRLLAAKQLLADTTLPITQVALASGYASVRRFNAAFVAHYRLNPTMLRRAGRAHDSVCPQTAQAIVVKLGYRPPYDVSAMLAFFAKRAIAGVDAVDATSSTYARTLSVSTPRSLGGRAFRDRIGENRVACGDADESIAVAIDDGGSAARCRFLGDSGRKGSAAQAPSLGTKKTASGCISVTFDESRSQVLLRVSDSLCEVLPQVISRVRALLDLDADPLAINQVLSASFCGGDGLRVPGTVDGFELAVRAVLGQQITVAAARTLAQRLVERFGASIDSVDKPYTAFGLKRLFPSAAVLAAATGDELGALGIVKQRQAAIVALARAIAEDRLHLHSGADVAATVAQLVGMPGIGDWTAQYIAMRALRWPDAFPAGDVALQKALGVAKSSRAAREAEALSAAWQPWRSYAVIRAWARL